MLVRLTESAENLMIQEPGIEKVVGQLSTFRVSILVQQSAGAVEMEMPISFSLIKNLKYVNSLPEIRGCGGDAHVVHAQHHGGSQLGLDVEGGFCLQRMRQQLKCMCLVGKSYFRTMAVKC